MARRYPSTPTAQPAGANLGDVLAMKLASSLLSPVTEALDPNYQDQQRRLDLADTREARQADQFDQSLALRQQEFDLAKRNADRADQDAAARQVDDQNRWIEAKNQQQAAQYIPVAHSEMLAINPQNTNAQSYLQSTVDSYGHAFKYSPQLQAMQDRLMGQIKDTNDKVTAWEQANPGMTYPVRTDENTGDTYYDHTKAGQISYAKNAFDKGRLAGLFPGQEGQNISDAIATGDPSKLGWANDYVMQGISNKVAGDTERSVRKQDVKDTAEALAKHLQVVKEMNAPGSTASDEDKAAANALTKFYTSKLATDTGGDPAAMAQQQKQQEARNTYTEWAGLESRPANQDWNPYDPKAKGYTVADQKKKVLERLANNGQLVDRPVDLNDVFDPKYDGKVLRDASGSAISADALRQMQTAKNNRQNPASSTQPTTTPASPAESYLQNRANPPQASQPGQTTEAADTGDRQSLLEDYPLSKLVEDHSGATYSKEFKNNPKRVFSTGVGNSIQKDLDSVRGQLTAKIDHYTNGNPDVPDADYSYGKKTWAEERADRAEKLKKALEELDRKQAALNTYRAQVNGG